MLTSPSARRPWRRAPAALPALLLALLLWPATAAASPFGSPLESGGVVRFGGVVPVAQSYGGADMGVSLEAGYHILQGRLGIEPRFATRFRAQDGPATTGGFAEVIFDVTAVHYLVSGPISPLVGGGLGVRYATASWLETRRDGEALQFVQEDRRTQSGWGLGGQIRTGVRFAMLAAVLDYNLNTVSIADRSVQQSVSFGIGVHF